MILTLIVGIVGIISTIVAWKFNPKTQIYVELDKIMREIEQEEKRRDKALSDNNSGDLTIVTFALDRLRKRKTDLLQRLANNRF